MIFVVFYKLINNLCFINVFNMGREGIYTIRGIMDTDGTIFVSKKPGIERYPTIEITTTSKVLANQLRIILLRQGFRVGNIRESTSKLSTRVAYRVPLYGKENIRKWLNEIGFSNEYKLNRAINYIQ